MNTHNINTSSPQLDSLPLTDLGQQQAGIIHGRTAHIIDSQSETTSVLAKSASSASRQAQKITSHQATALAPLPMAVSLSPAQASSPVDRISQLIEKGIPAEALFYLADVEGKKVLQPLQNLVAQAAAELPKQAFVCLKQESGKPLLLLRQDQIDDFQSQNVVFRDENGNEQEYDISALGEDQYGQLEEFINYLVENFAQTEVELPEESHEATKEESVQDLHHSNLYQARLAPKKEDNILNQATWQPSKFFFNQNPMAIVQQIIEAKITLEAKKEKQEKIQEAKKRQIEDQELRRDIRHEGYKQDEIQFIERQDEITLGNINRYPRA